MRLADHVARVRDTRNAYKFLLGNLKGRDYSEDLGVYGRIILKWVLKKFCVKSWTGFIWLRIRSSGDLVPSGSING
jgi:hypothetical protein